MHGMTGKSTPSGSGGSSARPNGARRRWADLPLRAKGSTILVIPVAVLVALAVASGIAASRASDTAAWVDHSKRVRAEIARLLQDLTEVESSVRGYLLTAAPPFLDPYREGRDQLDIDVEQLHFLTVDNAEQVASLGRLRELVADRFDLFDQALIGGPAGQLAGWRPPVDVLERGKEVTDDIKVKLDEMDREESHLLSLRTTSQHRAERAVVMIELIGLPFGVLAAIVAVVVFTGGVVRRVRTIEANAERLSRGESLVPLEPSGDEIGQLARALDRTAALLAERSATVARSVAEIEDLYDNAPCGYHSLGPDGTFERINRTELRWLGYERDEVVGKLRLPDVMTPESRDAFQRVWEEFVASGEIGDIEYDMVRKDGSLLPVSVSATSIRDKQGRFVRTRSTVFDVTERRRHLQELRDMATVDEATGLLNRRGFLALAEHHLALASRRGEDVSVLFLDLDGLKQVNDTQGHDVGTALIAEAGDVLRSSTRESDVVGRVGGDEFCVMLTPGGPIAEAAVMVRLEGAIAERDRRTSLTCSLQLSMGSSRTGPADQLPLEDLIRDADLLMYDHKLRRRASRTRPGAVTLPG
jgi:diguanylate cyclase (GGDEF)-like protein/PAS domain S-box-containing protein